MQNYALMRMPPDFAEQLLKKQRAQRSFSTPLVLDVVEMNDFTYRALFNRRRRLYEESKLEFKATRQAVNYISQSRLR